ncbi:hypothetical protein LG101_00005, partial [Levilactobacillus brevis]
MTQTTFYNCYFFDGTNDQNQTDTWFTVDDTGRITAIGHGTPTDTTDTVDLHGQYVMPGLLTSIRTSPVILMPLAGTSVARKRSPRSSPTKISGPFSSPESPTFVNAERLTILISNSNASASGQ